MSNREKIKEVETVIDALRGDIRYAELQEDNFKEARQRALKKIAQLEQQLEKLRGPALNYGQVWCDDDGEYFLVSAVDHSPKVGMLYQLVSLADGSRWTHPQKDPFDGDRDEFTYVGRADRVVQVTK